MNNDLLYFGTAGWSYPDWRGVFYPEGTSGKSPRSGGDSQLEFAARFLDALEINSSFYRVPQVRQAERWLEATRDSPHFLFSMKLWQGFTHSDEPIAARQAGARSIGATAEVLAKENRLACLLAQFPWSFKYGESQMERLRQLAGMFEGLPLVVETRHASWLRDEFFEFLERSKCGFCNIDQPVIGASIPPTARVVGGLGYVRLHGRRYDTWFADNENAAMRYDYLYPKEELAEWAERIREIARKANRTIVIANNHFRAKAVAATLELKSLVLGSNPSAPPELLAAYPHLKAFCKASVSIPQPRQMDFFQQ
ncbi:MAG: DUF72 domain-containing protein [Candidatus Sumerlaeota bacterium]|nr:DUF72 domain-containing protein [Candidatus Sumerlaeota bacterium]